MTDLLTVARNDEPSIVDELGRDKYAKAFAKLALSCETPMVIGIFAGWGVGKTTLMHLIREELDRDRTAIIWFDSWLHQYDDSPAVALLQTMVQQLDLGEEGKKIILAIATALSGALVKKLTGLAVKDIKELLAQYEEEQFQTREVRARLRDYFQQLARTATAGGTRRLIFFIDDLDRCSAETTLSMMEALKLYLNLPGCVYFLGVDRSAVERSISHRYGDKATSEIQYLDKIVQLPFIVPPTTPDAMGQYVSSLLSEALRPCRDILVQGLGDNPRRAKRFVNTLALNHELARESSIADYDVSILAAVLLIQYRNPRLHDRISDNPSLIERVLATDLPEDEAQDLFGEDMRLRGALKSILAGNATNIGQYLYLSRVAGAFTETDEFDVVLVNPGERKIQVIKAVREITYLGLTEAKDLIDSVPQRVGRFPRNTAREVVAKLEAQGAEVRMEIAGSSIQ
jgi:ribosomal protein L7/L12